MTTNVRVRGAVAEDHARLLPLAQQLATSYDVEVSTFKAVLDSQLVAPTGLVLVAEWQEQIVGYALAQLHQTFHANGPVVWVEEVMVAERHRGSGVGRALMCEIEVWGTSQGAAYVALATRRAGSFYTTLGYEPSATYYRRTLSPAISCQSS